jgi:hypothetical protein
MEEEFNKDTGSLKKKEKKRIKQKPWKQKVA